MDAATSNVPLVVIIGGGFAGLWATRALRRARVQITLVDRTNHHLFQPLLYQVATAGLASSDIAAPRNRIAVMINWLWTYTTYDRAARVVVGDTSVRDDSTHEFIP